MAYAQAGLLPAAPIAYAAAPIAKSVITKISDAEYDPHPQYTYSYDVSDSLTGDFKAQTESRDGDVVHGSYSLLEADGTKRIVDYTADSLNGFNAVVRKEPAAIAVKAAVAAPLAVAAPVAKLAPAPVVAAAPTHARLVYAPPAAPAPLAYATPVVKYAAPAAYPATYAKLAYSSPIAYAPRAYSLPAYYYRSFF